MARSLDQISTDLAKLDAATETLDQDLQAVYQEYLAVLGQAVQRQLVLAAYHLCTQAYPEKFLALTVAQREKLQAHLRQIAAQGQAQILQLGNVADLKDLASQLEDAVVAKLGALDGDPESDADEDAAIASTSSETATGAPQPNISDWTAAMLESATAAADSQSESAPPTPETDTSTDGEERPSSTEPAPASPDPETRMTEAAAKAALMLKRLGTSLSLFSILGAEPLTPVSLAKRHVLLERHLRAILRTLSGAINHLFKQAEILPDLPEMVIAAATEAEGSESGPSTPNLVSVLVEMGNRPDDAADDVEEADADDEFEMDEADREMTYLVAMNLRLADIEFADHQLALWRSRLQETLKKLKRLGSRYQKLQQEKARAEAEHAWRAIWFEES